MVYRPSDVFPTILKGISVSSRKDLVALGVGNLQGLRQYWKGQKEKYDQKINDIKKIISLLDGKTAAEIKSVADENRFCNCISCIYGKVSRLIGDDKPHVSCPLVPMFVDEDGEGPFLYIENGSAPLCSIANATSDEFIKICVKYLRSKIEIIKRRYNHANDCMVYLDGIIKHINRTPA